MTFLALSIEGSRDAGGAEITYFAIPAGQEAAAAQEVLDCLSQGFEISLNNRCDEGGEGYTSFRRSATGLETKTGGHGWSGSWQATDEGSVTSRVVALADYNRGGHWSAQASLLRRK